LEVTQKAGFTWVGIETDAGQGTKIHDKLVAKNCAQLSLQKLKDIRKKKNFLSAYLQRYFESSECRKMY